MPEDVREMVIAHWAKGAKDLFQRLPSPCITFYDGAVGGPSTVLRVADDQVQLVDHDPNENTVYGLGLPLSGHQALLFSLSLSISVPLRISTYVCYLLDLTMNSVCGRCMATYVYLTLSLPAYCSRCRRGLLPAAGSSVRSRQRSRRHSATAAVCC